MGANPLVGVDRCMAALLEEQVGGSARGRHSISGDSRILSRGSADKGVGSLKHGSKDSEPDEYGLRRSRTCDEKRAGVYDPNMCTPTATASQPYARSEGPVDYFSDKRRFSLQLPTFKPLGISFDGQILSVEDEELLSHQNAENIGLQMYSTTSSQLAIALFNGLPPLTPPPEDIPFSKLSSCNTTNISGSSIRSTPQSNTVNHQLNLPHDTPGGRLQGMTLPDSANISGPSQLQRPSWIAAASQKMLSAMNSENPPYRVEVVSQTLPSQAKDGRSRPTFEEILEILHEDMNVSPYITITHAVPPARVMEELPKTPPSTPNFRYHTIDYFDNQEDAMSQTIFTHAAVVPIYHSHNRIETVTASRLAHHIAAPGSTHVAILERYIPPTMPQEIDDFFSRSTRSYLADRLSELSAEKGSLLLIYPTKAGGETFAQKYIGPLIDPYLRRFVMLNDLTSAAAALMGKMTAVEHMIDFGEMKSRITSLCHDLSVRPPGRGPASAYSITHNETTNIVLDRSTWMNWYIEQEQARLRQNLVEYHQSGGRMPEPTDKREVTVGMLTRDFIDGIQKCKETAGNAEIEVGVFLITRSVF